MAIKVKFKNQKSDKSRIPLNKKLNFRAKKGNKSRILLNKKAKFSSKIQKFKNSLAQLFHRKNYLIFFVAKIHRAAADLVGDVEFPAFARDILRETAARFFEISALKYGLCAQHILQKLVIMGIAEKFLVESAFFRAVLI